MALKLSAEIALVKDDKSILDNHSSLLQQTADNILLKVSQSSFDLLTGRVATAESSIIQSANSIALKVSKDDVINQINLSTEGLAIDVNKLNINGIVTANSYFKINLDGSMESNYGKVGGFNIAPTKLFTTGVGLSIAQANQYVIWAGETNGANGYLNTDAKFLVESNGKVTAGNLYAYGGTIGGWTINGNSLSSGNMTLNSALGRLYVGSGAYLFNYGGTSVMGLNGSINIQGMIYAPSITLNGHVISIDSNGFLKAL